MEVHRHVQRRGDGSGERSCREEQARVLVPCITRIFVFPVLDIYPTIAATRPPARPRTPLRSFARNPDTNTPPPISTPITHAQPPPPPHKIPRRTQSSTVNRESVPTLNHCPLTNQSINQPTPHQPTSSPPPPALPSPPPRARNALPPPPPPRSSSCWPPSSSLSTADTSSPP